MANKNGGFYAKNHFVAYGSAERRRARRELRNPDIRRQELFARQQRPDAHEDCRVAHGSRWRVVVGHCKDGELPLL